MSCCGGNCGCGSGCKCGNGCGGCNMYLGLSYSEAAGSATETVVLGVARTNFKVSEMAMPASENDCKCKCGGACNCNPCNCK